MSRCQSLRSRQFGPPRSVVHTGVLLGVLLGLFAAVLAGCGSEPSPAPGQGSLTVPGQIVYTTRPHLTTQLSVMEADGTGQRPLLAPPRGVDRPSWSPDGTKIAYEMSGECSPECAQICVVNADGTDDHCITSAAVSSGGPSWSPDGDQIAFERGGFGDSSVFVMRADGTDERRLSEAPEDDADRTWSPADSHPKWSPDGSKIVFASNRESDAPQHLDLFVMRPDGSDVHRLTNSNTMDWAPDWSPDGKRIAFTRGFELWVMNADGSDQRPLSRTRPEGFQPAWAPDGTQIVFGCSMASWELCLINADGGGRRTATHGVEAVAPDWAPATGP